MVQREKICNLKQKRKKNDLVKKTQKDSNSNELLKEIKFFSICLKTINFYKNLSFILITTKNIPIRIRDKSPQLIFSCTFKKFKKEEK